MPSRRTVVLMVLLDLILIFIALILYFSYGIGQIPEA